MKKIENYKPGTHVEIELEKFGNEKESFTVKLPGGLGILELRETSLEAKYESSNKKGVEDTIKIGISKTSLLITKFFEDSILGGRKIIKKDGLNEFTPSSLIKLNKWIEENIISQIPSEDSDKEDSESTKD